MVAALRQAAAKQADTTANASNADSYFQVDEPVVPSSGTCPHCPADATTTTCCPECRERFWFRADYLLWWTKGSHLPPLVTTSPPGTPRQDAGVLGEPGTTILFGDEYVNTGSRSGQRLVAGVWLDSCARVGLAFDYFDLAAESTRFSASGDGSPILARPFYNVQTAAPSAQLMSFPGLISGSVQAHSRDYFQSTGAWLRCNLADSQWCPCDVRGYRVDLIAGYRYYRLSDALSIDEDLTATDPIFTGTTYDLRDWFQAENEFNGAELGCKTEWYRGRWSLGVLAKMAVGNNRQVVTIDGRTVTTLPGLLPVTEPGALLTAETNIGRYTRDQFTVIPQLGFELGFRLCDHARLLAGYDLIYWPHVLRAADQIDLAVDPRNIPPAQPGGTIFPAARLCSNDFWAQGLNLGLEVCY
ncbi:MAG: hypothetical protein A2W31_12660 [Planctomycetes bacterium RBG_16_64_10]|nr:MAG: hypothetical protein A2W31_12660 [Planctomycetes bacterium RBG_16_64_10]